MHIGIVVMAAGLVAVDLVLRAQGGGHGPAAFVGAADQALLVAVAFLVAAGAAVFWLPRHARAH